MILSESWVWFVQNPEYDTVKILTKIPSELCERFRHILDRDSVRRRFWQGFLQNSRVCQNPVQDFVRILTEIPSEPWTGVCYTSRKVFHQNTEKDIIRILSWIPSESWIRFWRRFSEFSQGFCQTPEMDSWPRFRQNPYRNTVKISTGIS